MGRLNYIKVLLIVLLVSTSSYAGRYKCSDCKKEFGYKCNLKNHKDTHNKEPRHKCLECGSLFQHATGLYNHMRTHKVPQLHFYANLV